MVQLATLSVALFAGLAIATNPPLDGPKPVDIGVVMFRGWQPLDVMGPLDALWGLSNTQRLNFYFIADTLDPVTSRGQMAPPVGSNVSTTVLTDYTFSNPPPNLDVLIVPGGMGTRAPAPQLDSAINFIRDQYPSLDYIISVCTGASLLARAGILDGKRATTNKRAWAFVTQFGERVRWQPKARYVRDGKIWTTSGVSAGVDGVLGWIEYVWGSASATTVENGMEWTRVGANNDKFCKLYDLC